MSRNINTSLTELLPRALDGACLRATRLPLTGNRISLYLLNADYPQQSLGLDAVRHLMQDPLYWIFCWASGQVLATELLRNPQRVRGRRVVDFGSGSGVVAIAAALAGAREVIACDRDPHALRACSENACLNRVELTLAAGLDDVVGSVDVITAADVLYDRDNLRCLDLFLGRAALVLVADSRVRDFDYPPYQTLLQAEASTWPDLGESAEFRQVSVYFADNTRSSTAQERCRRP